MKKPILVTGGCGFVGRNLIRRLLKEENQVWVIDNLFTGLSPDNWLYKDYKRSIYKKGVELYSNKKSMLYFINADLVDFLGTKVEKKNILPMFSDVFHLASIVGGRSLIDGDPLLVAKDLAIDACFFTWLTRNTRSERAMYASSSAAYPIILQGKKASKLRENMIRFSDYIGVPDMTYGWSKLSGEFLSNIAHKKYGVNICCVRPFSGYGEDQEKIYPIPAIARRVARREDPIDVWGTGLQGRDFVHINDCIDAFFIAINNIKDGSAVNIGSGELTSFVEVINLFCEIEGYEPNINKLTDKPIGVMNRYSNNKKLMKMGWKQKISNKEGFTRVLNYVKRVKR